MAIRGVVEMSVSLLAVIVDCHDPRSQAEFWAEALGSQVLQRNPGEFGVRDDDDGSGTLYFMAVPEPKTGKNRLHVDLLTDGPLEAEVTRLTDAGAELVEIRQDPSSFDNPDRWAVMVDPEGNEFCVTSTDTFTWA